MYCKRCSKEIDDHAEVCPYCGQEVFDSDRAEEIDHEEKKLEKTGTGMIVGLVLNMFGLVGLSFLDKAGKKSKKKKKENLYADSTKVVDRNSYIRGVFFGSIIQILIILLIVSKLKK